jgi:hypothetical protein
LLGTLLKVVPIVPVTGKSEWICVVDSCIGEGLQDEGVTVRRSQDDFGRCSGG